jgi:hypothetical protein
MWLLMRHLLVILFVFNFIIDAVLGSVVHQVLENWLVLMASDSCSFILEQQYGNVAI